MQFISVAFLLFAAEALAVNIQYSCRYTEGGLQGKGGNESAASGSIDEQQAQDIVSHMATWSEDKFEATRKTHDKAISDTVIVKCKNAVKTKKDALEEIKEQQKLVKDHKDD